MTETTNFVDKLPPQMRRGRRFVSEQTYGQEVGRLILRGALGQGAAARVLKAKLAGQAPSRSDEGALAALYDPNGRVIGFCPAESITLVDPADAVVDPTTGAVYTKQADGSLEPIPQYGASAQSVSKTRRPVGTTTAPVVRQRTSASAGKDAVSLIAKWGRQAQQLRVNKSKRGEPELSDVQAVRLGNECFRGWPLRAKARARAQLLSCSPASKRQALAMLRRPR